MDSGQVQAGLLAAAVQACQRLDFDEFLGACAGALQDLLHPAALWAYLASRSGEGSELRGSWPERRRGTPRPPRTIETRLLEAAAGGSGPEGGEAERAGAFAWLEGGERGVVVLSIAHGRASRGFFLAMPRIGEEGFDPARVEGARAFLALLGPSLANVLYVGDLREAAVRDDLARCYNRRHFESFLEEEVARARRFRSRVSVVFLDMDDLKSVNTIHGHAMGSRSLQEVAERVSAGIRSIDKLFRFGGDEFCMVLPQTDTRGATEVAERVRQAIASEPVLVEEIGGVRMSASLGVATFPDHAGQPGDLVQAADRAMQEAKRRGKNSVAFAAAAPRERPGDGAGREEGA